MQPERILWLRVMWHMAMCCSAAARCVLASALLCLRIPPMTRQQTLTLTRVLCGTMPTGVDRGVQSNMEFRLEEAYDADTLIAAAGRPELRLFTVVGQGSSTPLPELRNSTAGSKWQVSTPNSVATFSAVCYLTALQLQKLHHHGSVGAVYGLIESAVGSTDVQSWMAAEARADALRNCWTPKNATELPPSHSHAPANQTVAGELYNAMIHPLAPFALSAVLWDQGENNAQYCTAAEYNCLFTSMATHWRKVFGQPYLPFGWAQIGGYAIDIYDKGGASANSVIRFGQGDSLPANTDQIFDNKTAPANPPERFPLAVSAMAQTFDLGSPQPNNSGCQLRPGSAACWWIHCRNKTEVARRLALQLAHVWTAPGGRPLDKVIEWSGPVVIRTQVGVSPDSHLPYAEVELAHAQGLALLPAQGCFHCCNQTGPPPRGYVGAGEWLFEVANRRGDWLPATGAVISTADKPTVRVTPLSPVTCKNPDLCWLAGVRYAVMDVPQCALYNAAQLPGGQFELPVPWARGLLA